MNPKAKHWFTRALALLTLLGLPWAARAQTWTESGDAGELPTSAQAVYGVGALTTITGTIGANGFGGPDVDMYLLNLTGNGTFSATTVGLPGDLFDTQLFLFTLDGLGVYSNDDDPSAFGGRSTLPAFHPLTPVAPGLYYLVVSAYGRKPTSSAGLIFPETPFTGVLGPTGPGGAGPITGYTGTTAEAQVSYTIALTGAQPAAIPEPGTLVLVSMTALGLLLSRRPRHNA